MFCIGLLRSKSQMITKSMTNTVFKQQLTAGSILNSPELTNQHYLDSGV